MIYSLAFLFLFLFCHQLHARTLSDAELFRRCYQLFTRSELVTHPLYASVQSGNVSGVNACKQLINLVSINLQPSGVYRLGMETDETTQKIIDTFQNLHNRFFTVYSQGLNIEAPETREIIDTNLPGYYATLAMFNIGTPLSAIVNSQLRLSAYRELTNRTAWIFSTRGNFGFPWMNGGTTWNPQYYERGKLRGFNSYQGQIIPNSPNGENWSLFASLGAGAIGTAPVLLRADKNNPQSTSFAHRRLVRFIYADFLCLKDFPVISNDDAQPYVDPNGLNAFQKSLSCVRCHQTMDKTAGYFRNISHFVTGNGNNPQAKLVSTYDASLPAENPLLSWTAPLARRAPRGQVFFRDYKNDLIESSVGTGIQQFGNEIANTDQFFACMVSKYMEGFLGIEAKLHNLELPGAPALNQKETDHRNFAIAIGQEVKNNPNQDPKIIIHRLIENYLIDSNLFGEVMP